MLGPLFPSTYAEVDPALTPEPFSCESTPPSPDLGQGVSPWSCAQLVIAVVFENWCPRTAPLPRLRAVTKGSSLVEVGQVLRHCDVETTAIYAKVDLLALDELVVAWPGDAHSGQSLSMALVEYLAVRRSLGFKLARDEMLLGQFVSFCDDSGADRVTAALALEWVCAPPGASAGWLRMRLTVVRGFANWLQASDPATEVPPLGWLPLLPRNAISLLAR